MAQRSQPGHMDSTRGSIWDEDDSASDGSGEHRDRQDSGQPAEPDFYDADLDQQDERWVNRQRGGRQSDAHLSCPGCFTTLCTDCQQHAQNPNRFRAAFVVNCRIDKAAQEMPRQPPQRRGKRQRGRNDASTGQAQPSEVFHPVHCSECDTKVGAWSADDIYHFFAVIASTS